VLSLLCCETIWKNYLDANTVRQPRVLNAVAVAERITGRKTGDRQGNNAEEKNNPFHLIEFVG